MKTIEECFDHVLKCLNETKRGEIICFGFIEDDKIINTNEYDKMYNPLNLVPEEFIELLDILKDKGHVKYGMMEGEEISVMDMKNGDIYHKKPKHIGLRFEFTPVWILITLQGKFFIRQGGFQGEEKVKNAEKNRIKKQDEQIRLLTLLLAIGSIGVLIIEVLKFLLDYF